MLLHRWQSFTLQTEMTFRLSKLTVGQLTVDSSAGDSRSFGSRALTVQLVPAGHAVCHSIGEGEPFPCDNAEKMRYAYLKHTNTPCLPVYRPDIHLPHPTAETTI